jgi:hypothetical protein
MQIQTAGRAAAPPTLADNEERWRALNAELAAAEAELQSAQPADGSLLTAEVIERFEAARRHRYHVQFAILDFLDGLDLRS